MKHSRIAQRVLSLALTGALLLPSLGGISPAMAANGEIAAQLGSTPISLNFKAESDGKWNPEGESPTRVWLNVDDNTAVVDDFSYTVTSDKDSTSAVGERAADRYNVDQYGYLTLKENKLPIEGEILTIEASVDYFDGDDVVFADNVVDSTSRYTSGAAGTTCGVSNTSAVNKQVARTGEYGITTASGTGNYNKAPFYKLDQAAEAPVTVTAWYYDPATAAELAYVKPSATPGLSSAEGQLGVFFNAAAVGDAAIDFIGVAYVSAGTNMTPYNLNNYYLRGGGDGKSYQVGSARSEGWHKMVWEVSSSQITMTISKLNADGTLTSEGTHTATNTNKVTSIAIANNKGNCDYSINHMENCHFLDDISIVATDATPTTGTVSIQIPVNYTAPKAPVIATQPTDTTVAEGETVTLTVEATNPANGELAYAWFKADASDAVGQAVADANADTLTFAGATPGVSYYYCNVTNVNGTTKSTAAKVTVIAESSRPATPGAPSIEKDGSVTFAYTGQGDTSFKMSIYRSGENTPAATATKVIALSNSNWANTILLTELRALGEGSYTVTATRLGGEGALDSLESAASLPIVLSKLSTPNAPIWYGATAKWAAVPDAKSYSVQLYANGVKQGPPVSTTSTECALTIAGTPPYTATVIAVADVKTLAFDSAESPKSAERDESLHLAFDVPTLHKGETERIYIDGPNDIVIADYTFTSTDPSKLVVDKYGNLTVAEDYSPSAAGETVQVKATVRTYNSTIWSNNFETRSGWTDTNPTIPNINYSTANPHTGRVAGTPNSTIKDSSYSTNLNGATGTLVFWYYDTYTAAEKASDYSSQAKFGMMINDHPTFFAGVAIPTAAECTTAGYDRAEYITHYGYREAGTWYPTNIERTPGWHKFEIKVTSSGATYSVDGVEASIFGKPTPILNPNVTSFSKVLLTTNWGNQGNNAEFINNKHFVDDVYVLADNAAPPAEVEKTIAITIKPKNYQITSTPAPIDLNYPTDAVFTITPDLKDLVSAKVGGQALTQGADFAVDGSAFTVKKEYLVAKGAGTYTIVLDMGNGIALNCDVTARHPEARAYYVDSAHGNDANDGLTSDTAWKSLAKLNAAAPFCYGDRIYLEANSAWNGQLVLSGDGKPGNIISLTRYTVENGVTKYGADCTTQNRPVINGNGTVGTVPNYMEEHGFDGRYKFNGAVELWNSGYWEISWLEVTNLGETSTDGNGRCGIMVMNEWSWSVNGGDAQDFIDSRKDHVYITDSYVHDVNGLFQDYQDINGVAGSKHSGGIIGFGYLSDFRVERCRVSKVDIEGIRTSPFHPGGTQSAAGYPKDIATNTVFRNNFIDKLHGDAIVIAGANDGVVEYNVATQLGRSYVSKKDNSNYVPGTEPVNLNTGKNFAAIWFMGCGNSVAQYNEVYDTQYTCPGDGEAWDVDMHSNNCVYQYNYSHHNSGGCVLFMNRSQVNSTFRYNLSTYDGGEPGNRAHLIYYAASSSNSSNEYPLIHNNVFILNDKITNLLDGNNDASKYIHIQNNIFYADNNNTPRLLYKTDDKSDGELNNNIFYPAALYGANITDYLKGTAVGGQNFTVDPKLVQIDTANIPTLSEAWTTEVNSTVPGDDTTGVILSGDNWFDAKVNELLGGYKLQADSPAINKGVRVPYWDGVAVEDRFPLTRDFFGNAIDESDSDWVPDIGIHEYTEPVPDGSFKVTFSSNGGTTQANPKFVIVENGQTVGTMPTAPNKTGYAFEGWNTEIDGSGSPFTAETVVTESLTVYAQWRSLHYTYTVTFDKNGGDTEASPASKTITDPATSLGSLPTAPSKADFAFAGWNTKADGTGSVFTAKSKISGDVTVYAQWKPIGSYTVTYDKNGGDTEAAPGFQIVVPPATNVGTLPAAPSRSGYTFTGWNTTKTGSGTAFTGSTEVTGNITVYAQWQVYTPAPSPSTPKPTPKPEEKPAGNVTATEGGQVTVKENKDGSSTYTFKPEKEKEVLYVRVNGLLVKADSYTAAKGETPSIVVVFGENGTDHSKDYTDTAALPEYMTEAVNYVVGSGLFQGNGESFVPMGNMNRAMFATVLARLYGADTTKLTSDFADVAQGSWYEGGVAWISDMGITSGVGGGNFAPEADMTRQELVTLVYRFAQKVGADVSATGALTTFPDGGSVDTWSSEAMSWAVGLGMITGKDGSLAPNDTITRVEAAIILQRMANLLVKA